MKYAHLTICAINDVVNMVSKINARLTRHQRTLARNLRLRGAYPPIYQIGCIARSYQENRRELWKLDDVEFMIDTWPYFEPYIEVESTSENAVRDAAQKAGFDWNSALFCGVSKLFQMKYGEHMHMRLVPRIAFDMPNPFV